MPATGGSEMGGGTQTAGGTKASTAGTKGLELGGSTSTTAGMGGSGGKPDDMSGCGDGVLLAAALGEVCDDGNSDSGDGCSADCQVIEQNYSCLAPGQPCQSTFACGVGKVAGT
jgi:cysteine-rich repeat protein